MLCKGKTSLVLIEKCCRVSSNRVHRRVLSTVSDEVATVEDRDIVSSQGPAPPPPVSPHFKPLTQQTRLADNIHPHRNLIKKMYSEAQDRDMAYFGRDKKQLLDRPDYKHILQTIRRPEVQSFIDDLQSRFLEELPTRKEEAEQAQQDTFQIRTYPDCLLDLDPFNYIREEEMFLEHEKDEYPLGVQDMVSTGTAVNKTVMRTPLDFAYLVKNEGIPTGTGEFFKTYFSQGKASFTAKYRSVKNRGYDHQLADRSYWNRNLASQLQERYLKHFELIAEGRWSVLLDYMADFKVADVMNQCNQAEPDVVKSWFTVKFIKNNKKPKILSHFEVPYEDKKFTQVLVRFDMEVECLNFDEDQVATLGPHNMVHYVVFERDVNDFLSTFRIIDKVSEEDIRRFKRHKVDLAADAEGDN